MFLRLTTDFVNREAFLHENCLFFFLLPPLFVKDILHLFCEKDILITAMCENDSFYL